MPTIDATMTRLRALGVKFNRADLPLLAQHSWAINVRTGYVFSPNSRPAVYMHRLVACAVKGELIDHRNGDRKDNRTINLRIVTRSENSCHRVKLPSTNTSGHLGVHPHRNHWRARIRVNGRQLHLGTFRTKAAAVLARRRAEALYYGSYAPTISR